VYNGTLNSTTYTDPSTQCAFEYQTSSTTITGGEVMYSGVVAAGGSLRSVIADALKTKLTL
jgi:hypothetical protein